MPSLGWSQPETRAKLNISVVSLLAEMSENERQNFLDSLTNEEALQAIYSWELWARPNQLPPMDCSCHNGQWNTWLAMAGRGFGKLLDIHTPIPTPTGWSILADLQIGDTIFDEYGNPCRVIATFDDMPTTSYRLTFSDGEYLDACAEHQWITWTHADRRTYLRCTPHAATLPDNWPTYAQQSKNGPQVRTTQQIIDTFTHSKRGDLNHCIPLTAPLILPPQELLVDPYILGYWLGDGSSRDGTITAHEDDQSALFPILRKAGYQPHSLADSQQVGTYGLQIQLKQLGVLRNKHVPPQYLRGSIDQRLALLQGLLDSDGYIDQRGYIEFSNTNFKLVEAVVELARTLGQKPQVYAGRARLYGRDCGDKWRVYWRPTLPVFTLPRKLARYKTLGAQGFRSQHRMITDYQNIDPKPMRCLTVDSPNSLFLVGHGMIPTHNTRLGAEYVRKRQETGKFGRFALVGRSAADVRDTMVEGESGLINISPPWNRPSYVPSKRRVEWPNGAAGVMFSADEPDQLRGWQSDTAWCDELAAWRYPDAWDQLQFGLRLGTDPRVVVTTTPRPTKLMRELVANQYTHVTTGRTYDNIANLARSFADQIIKKYEGTRMGRQELEGLLLEDVEGALWHWEMFEDRRMPNLEDLWRIVVAIDPSVKEGGKGAEAGIIVAGIDRLGIGFIIDDCSVRDSPLGWAKAAVNAYHRYRADTIIAEINNGGALVEAIIRTVDPNASYKAVHAARGKMPRAEPVVSLYQQKRVIHAREFPELEDQLCTWVPTDPDSPDRLDAAVWAITELMITQEEVEEVMGIGYGRAKSGWTRPKMLGYDRY